MRRDYGFVFVYIEGVLCIQVLFFLIDAYKTMQLPSPKEIVMVSMLTREKFRQASTM
jgi:hypothetical protein